MKHQSFKLRNTALLRAMQIAGMTMSVLTTPAFAQLLDHGPADAVLTWPQWYRDNDGTEVGLCKSIADSPNAPGSQMCFPLVPDPAGFPGNVGEEAFYNMVEYVQKPGAAVGFNFRYLAALEASYLPGPIPVKGQETVFSRVRIAFNFNNPAFDGHYKITHPFGVDEFDAVATDFNSVQGSQASVFYTNDIPGIAGNVDGALGGTMGPFIKWDADPQLGADGFLTVGSEKFLGDPNVPHTIVGSPFTDANGNPQNYIKIEGPAGADLGNGPGVPLVITEMNVLGQVWTAPIAANLQIDQAIQARSNTTGLNSIDVWATSSTGHKLILTPSNGLAMPSMEMQEDQVAKGHYHGHIEYPVASAVPASITVTDNTSVPIISASKALADGVEISMAQYDTNTGNIYIRANSTDEVGVLPRMTVENIPGVSGVRANLSQAACAATIFGTSNAFDKCFSYTLPSTIEPPKFIAVRSAEGGSHDDQLVMLTGNPQNITPAPANPGTLARTVSSNGTTVFTGANALPANTLIVTQPSQGTITLNANGLYQFTANAGATVGPDSFKIVVQNPTTKAVSKVGAVNLDLQFSPSAPLSKPDQFAALAGAVPVAKNMAVLANDQPATADAQNQINPSSLAIVTNPTRGTVVVGTGANGTPVGQVKYTANVRATANDSFTYKVANNAGIYSAPVTVNVTNFAAAETITYTKPNYINSKWTIVAATNWFGANLTQSSISCFLTANNGVTLATPRFIGSALIDGTGKAQVVAGATPAAGPTSATISCTTSNGGTRTSAVAFR